VKRLFFLFSFFLVLFLSKETRAQASACPSVNAGPDVTICGGCTTLNATVQGSVGTTTYSTNSIPYNPYPYSGGTPVLINIDDTWSPVVNLPFCFNFFGQTYNQFVIGSNAIITFDLTQANQYCQWPINNAIPSNQNPMNSIMAPFHDIDPSVPVIGMPNSSADINWAVYGTAPCREMVISWDSVAMFSCNAMIASSQLVLHETTNIIDIYIREKPTCAAWNAGAAIEGIQDATGSTAYFVPGRNYPTNWSVNNDGWRFMPTGPPNYTFAWLDPSNNVISNALSFVVCPTQTTTYTAQVTNQSCNGPNIIVTDQITVTVAAGNLSVAMASTPSICNTATGTATATPTGTGPFTYSWAPGGQTTQSISGLTAGTYSCTVTDANGCVVTQTVVVASSSSTTVTLTAQTNLVCNGANNGSATVSANGGQGPYTYSWAPSGGNSATATGLAAGTYTVTVTDANNCTSTQTVTITQPAALTLALASTNISCFGGGNGSATATGGGGTGPYTYVWQPGGQTTATISNLAVGNYTCTITDANGCVTTQTTAITQPQVFTSNISNTVNTSCGQNNGSATAAVAGGTGPFNYAWSPSGGNAQTASSLAPGNYTVNIVDANGCTTSSTVTILPSVPAVASFSGIDTTGCAPICVQFTNTSPAAVSCLWDFGDNLSSTNCNTIHCYTIPGIYTVSLTITDGTGCTATATHTNMVDVYPQPVASFIADPDSASEFDPVIYFMSTSTNSTSWTWTFGDSAQGSSNMQNTNYTYSDTGSYVVTLVVSNSFGCTDSISETVFIVPEFTFYAPNAFTPNGDGKNDIFLPMGTDINENTFHLWIFDRWGNLIFETKDFNKGWDGRANGGKDVAQIDTYVWKVSFTDLLNKNHKFVGHVSLIK
jgi:gliding motility-associated-like protein